MTEDDFKTFRTAFDRVCAVFRLRLKPIEAHDLCRTYYAILEAFPIDDVLLAGKACLANSKTFPRPAQWLAEVTARSTAPPIPTTVRVLTPAELEELTAAEQQRYIAPPCACASCYLAGVDDRELRFVPTLIAGLEDRAWHPTRHTSTIVGHWAHGQELAQWYAAREALAAAVPVRYAYALVGAGREPGEEG